MSADDLRRSTSKLRRQLGAELAHLRRLAGIGGHGMAATTGMSQSSVSRVESGKRAPSRREVEAWLEATAADDAIRDRVGTLLGAVHAETVPWRELLEDVGQLQDAVGARERSARLAQEWSPDVVPGLLQTRAYAEALMPLVAAPGIDAAATVERRMQRQRVLYEPGRRFVFLLPENVLRRPVAGPEAMIEQREHIMRLTGVPGVEIDVVPEPWSVIASSEFVLYDELDDGAPFVAIELTHGPMVLSDERDVAIYRSVFERLRAHSRPPF